MKTSSSIRGGGYEVWGCAEGVAGRCDAGGRGAVGVFGGQFKLEAEETAEMIGFMND